MAVHCDKSGAGDQEFLTYRQLAKIASNPPAEPYQAFQLRGDVLFYSNHKDRPLPKRRQESTCESFRIVDNNDLYENLGYFLDPREYSDNSVERTLVALALLIRKRIIRAQVVVNTMESVYKKTYLVDVSFLRELFERYAHYFSDVILEELERSIVESEELEGLVVPDEGRNFECRSSHARVVFRENPGREVIYDDWHEIGDTPSSDSCNDVENDDDGVDDDWVLG